MSEETKSLAQYAEALKKNGLAADIPEGCEDVRISGICFDSREAASGSLFICKGAGFKEEYLRSAAEKGAAAAVAERSFSADIPVIVVSDIRKAMAVVSNVWNGEAWRSFKLVGFTGTKGKSTALYYLKSIWDKRARLTGEKPMGYVSTIDTFDGINEYESHLTTPEAPELAAIFANAKKAGLPVVGMEVSSQALKYDRTLGVQFDIGFFLNFGRDHIGETEHPDEDDYFRSKVSMLSQCRTVCINLDTERIAEVIEAAKASPLCEKIIYYSPSGSSACGIEPEYTASDVRKENSKTVFSFNRNGERVAELSLSMPGLFNVDNAVAAAIAAIELGISADDIKRGLIFASVPGRMEVFESLKKDITVIVDYAHNEMSFERLFSSVKQEYPGRRIEALFGCPGGKGRQRRIDLPRVAAKYADLVWFTEEDPAFDDVGEICEELLRNLESFGGKGRIVTDRAEAVRTAIDEAKAGTVLLLIAKGREKYMHRGSEYVAVKSDVELTKEYLEITY